MKKRPWTEEEILVLKGGGTPENRSRFSIKCMRQRLGLVPYHVLRWTEEHKDMLKKLIASGHSYEEVSKLLPYRVKGIQKQAIKMSLQKTRQYKFTARELMKFRTFLEKNWEGKTPNELMESWNKDNKKKICKKKVTYHLKKLGIKIPKEESLRLGFLKNKDLWTGLVGYNVFSWEDGE